MVNPEIQEGVTKLSKGLWSIFSSVNLALERIVGVYPDTLDISSLFLTGFMAGILGESRDVRKLVLSAEPIFNAEARTEQAIHMRFGFKVLVDDLKYAVRMKERYLSATSKAMLDAQRQGALDRMFYVQGDDEISSYVAQMYRDDARQTISTFAAIKELSLKDISRILLNQVTAFGAYVGFNIRKFFLTPIIENAFVADVLLAITVTVNIANDMVQSVLMFLPEVLISAFQGIWSGITNADKNINSVFKDGVTPTKINERLKHFVKKMCTDFLTVRQSIKKKIQSMDNLLKSKPLESVPGYQNMNYRDAVLRDQVLKRGTFSKYLLYLKDEIKATTSAVSVCASFAAHKSTHHMSKKATRYLVGEKSSNLVQNDKGYSTQRTAWR